MLYVQQQYFLNAHCCMSVYVLTVFALQQIYSTKTKHIYIAMHITVL